MDETHATETEGGPIPGPLAAPVGFVDPMVVLAIIQLIEMIIAWIQGGHGILRLLCRPLVRRLGTVKATLLSAPVVRMADVQYALKAFQTESENG